MYLELVKGGHGPEEEGLRLSKHRAAANGRKAAAGASAFKFADTYVIAGV